MKLKYPALLALLCASFTQASEVFINEIHYDNAGTDTDETIEIAGPSGTDLTGWSLVLYNGANGASYTTTPLLGTLLDQQDGFGTLSFSYPVNGIQNGSPDGVALINVGGEVVQFLSYEGAFAAINGPASGMSSNDIGVSESSTTFVGHSLQLSGSGTTSDDFSWQAASVSTFDDINTGQSFGGGDGLPVIIINEVDSDTPGSDAAEFVELYDGGVGSSDLDGLVVVFYNGSSNLSYASYDLDGFSTNADGYFLLGNAGVTPTPDIIFSGNGLQNGADAVALYADDASNFPKGTAVTTNNIRDAIVYDTNDSDDAELLVLLNAAQPQIDENGAGDKNNHSNQRCPNGSGGPLNTSAYAQYIPTPGAANTCVVQAIQVFIHEVQGAGPVSPLSGQIVAIEGIVVGDFQDGISGTNGDLNGFHVQEEDADADADPNTSEGVFVFNGSSPAVNVQMGDLVRVEGLVSEFNGMTEITSFTGVTVLSRGHPLPTTSVLSLPVSSADDFEAYEGMFVTFPQALVIAEYFNFDRFNEIVLTSERHLTPTAEFEPGADAIAAAADFLLDKITLDDGRSGQNSDPAIHPNGGDFNLTNLFRGGDTVANVTGVLDYSFGTYRIQPTQGADYVAVNLRTTEPEHTGGNLKVASFNVLNYFNGDGLGGGFPTSRGADNLDEFTRQRDKIVAAMVTIDADVFGVMEIENDGYDSLSAIQDLVNGLNDATLPGTYSFVDPGIAKIGTDQIAVGFIFNQTKVAPHGISAILDASVDPRFDDTKNRPAMAQTFVATSTGAILTVAVNHLKSKGSNCDSVGDPNTGDGAGNCNLTRASAAAALVDWLGSDPTDSNDSDVLIIGDLNSYDKEEPIDVLIDGGYTDLAASFNGEAAYSYVFDGQIGYLDYALANPSLLSQVAGITEWHINADETDLINYDTSFKKDAQDAIYARDAYRSSDHDPVIVGLELLNYGFTGFFRPIDNAPAMNRIKAGRSVPVKFSLNSDYGLDIFAAGYPISQQIDCDSGSLMGASEETATAGGSSLSNEEDSGQYNYVWKTEKAWKGSCRRLSIQLIDGSSHFANFQLK
jgi:predicted extracellular nuclease